MSSLAKYIFILETMVKKFTLAQLWDMNVFENCAHIAIKWFFFLI